MSERARRRLFVGFLAVVLGAYVLALFVPEVAKTMDYLFGGQW